MKSGDFALAPAGELLSMDDQTSIDQAAAATYEEEFHEQWQKVRRLNQYYDDVVAELRTLLDQSEEGSYIRPSVAAAPSEGE
jgi:hypothetical protein